jgi:peptide/nickel transport system substrate-binding protein
MARISRHRAAISVVAATAAAALALAACGRSAPGAGTTAGNLSPTKGLVVSTKAGTKPVSSVTWAVYRDVNSLDPIYAFDYPENTALSLMCESLLKQSPDGGIGPGLATLSNPSPTKFVFTIQPGAKFWDGHPVTPADVVYSLDRANNAKLGGFYTLVFSRVATIAATGSNQVTITLKQPDYWLQGELASMPGIIIEKAFAEKQGKKYGTPSGSIMCTGAYKFKSFVPGVGVTAVSTLRQLETNSAVTIYKGQGWSTDAFIVDSTKGVLGDVRVREALSMALNRNAIINNVFKGAGLLPRWLSNPGVFGYGKSVFDKAYNASPVLPYNLAKAKQLVKAAGAVGKTFTIGTSSQISNIAQETGAYEQAANAIGLKTVLKSVSAQNYINFFIDPKARVGVDGFLTVNYGDYADPAALLSTLVIPGGSQNYDNFNDPKIISLLEQARSTADPNARAALVAKAEERSAALLPWIPDVQPVNIMIMSKNLTGATASFAYMFAPWANSLGGS